MRNRLLLVLLPLLALLLIALETLLAQSYASRLTQELYFQRLLDVENLAARVEPVLRDQTAGGERRL